MYGTSIFTLSEQLGITVEEAEAFIENFLTQYNVVAKWIDSVHELVDRQGYVETMFGRKEDLLDTHRLPRNSTKLKHKW